MLEQLFGSRTRVKLLRLFLGSPNEHFFVREITRVVDEQINSVRRELQNLEKIHLLTSVVKEKKKYYMINLDFPLLQELQALILKTRVVNEKAYMKKIRELGEVEYFALYGQFVGDEESPTDIFIIGKVDKEKLEHLVKEMSKTFHKDLRYTVMPVDEYEYRREVADRFIFDMLNRQCAVIENQLQVNTPGALDDIDNPFYSKIHSPSQTRWTKQQEQKEEEQEKEVKENESAS